MLGALVAGTFPPLMVGALVAELVIAAVALALAAPRATILRGES